MANSDIKGKGKETPPPAAARVEEDEDDFDELDDVLE
jgi:hypothetical protein